MEITVKRKVIINATHLSTLKAHYLSGGYLLRVHSLRLTLLIRLREELAIALLNRRRRSRGRGRRRGRGEVDNHTRGGAGARRKTRRRAVVRVGEREQLARSTNIIGLTVLREKSEERSAYWFPFHARTANVEKTGLRILGEERKNGVDMLMEATAEAREIIAPVAMNEKRGLETKHLNKSASILIQHPRDGRNAFGLIFQLPKHVGIIPTTRSRNNCHKERLKGVRRSSKQVKNEKTVSVHVSE